MEIDDTKNYMVYQDNGDGTMIIHLHVEELGIRQTMIAEMSFNEMMAGVIQSIQESPELVDLGRDFMGRTVEIPNFIEEQ